MKIRKIQLKTEKREMTFSLTQSNILYLLFILGSAVCILGELNILGLRESTPSTMLSHFGHSSNQYLALVRL